MLRTRNLLIASTIVGLVAAAKIHNDAFDLAFLAHPLSYVLGAATKMWFRYLYLLTKSRISAQSRNFSPFERM